MCPYIVLRGSNKHASLSQKQAKKTITIFYNFRKIHITVTFEIRRQQENKVGDAHFKIFIFYITKYFYTSF